jgi:hypothetical protein
VRLQSQATATGQTNALCKTNELRWRSNRARIDDMEEQTAYNDGRMAFEEDAELTDDPYPELTGDWKDWRTG